MLVLAYRPFTDLHPYAETGPIFLCADACEAPAPSADLPGILTSESYLLRGYDAEELIVYGSGRVIPTEGLAARARALFEDPRIAYLHLRSASNNCFQVRVEREQG